MNHRGTEDTEKIKKPSVSSVPLCSKSGAMTNRRWIIFRQYRDSQICNPRVAVFGRSW
jgi:hypothetical protein